MTWTLVSSIHIHLLTIELFLQSPGRDSPGDESSASIATVESVSSGCRNSTTSLDSGRASNSNSNSTASETTTASAASSSTFHTIHEHRPVVNIPNIHVPSPQACPPRLSRYVLFQLEIANSGH